MAAPRRDGRFGFHSRLAYLTTSTGSSSTRPSVTSSSTWGRTARMRCSVSTMMIEQGKSSLRFKIREVWIIWEVSEALDALEDTRTGKALVGAVHDLGVTRAVVPLVVGLTKMVRRIAGPDRSSISRTSCGRGPGEWAQSPDGNLWVRPASGRRCPEQGVSYLRQVGTVGSCCCGCRRAPPPSVVSVAARECRAQDLGPAHHSAEPIASPTSAAPSPASSEITTLRPA